MSRAVLLLVACLGSGCAGYTIAPSLSLENDKGHRITAAVVIIRPDRHSNK